MGRTLAKVLERVGEEAAITEARMGEMRRAVYEDGRVDPREIRALLQLHKNGAGTGPAAAAWADFFVEAIADYFAIQREAPLEAPEYAPDYARALSVAARAMSPLPRHKQMEGVSQPSWTPEPLTPADAGALVLAFRAEGGLVLDPVERRALARLFDRVVDLPAELTVFARDAVYATVMADGRIDEDEVALLRRVLYGPGGADGVAISRAEAELVFAIADAARAGENAAGWTDLFVKAITSYLLFAGPSPERIDGGEAAWLAAKLGPAEGMDGPRRALIANLARETDLSDRRLAAYVRAG